MTTPAICQGARGFVVERLQRGLKVTADGDFGKKTTAAVVALQTALGYVANGRADAEVFDAVRVPFPGKFERCLAICDAFEGTGFGGINTTDIDGAGVTLGIAGFTTASGEVQRIVSEYVRMRPDALRRIPTPSKEKLKYLVKMSGRNREAWDRWFYGNDEVVDKWIREIVGSWGEDEYFRKMQLSIVEAEMWLPAVKAAKTLGIDKSMAGLALMLDIRIQNGGWAERHIKVYRKRNPVTVADKLLAIAESVAECATAKWRSDVLARKMIFARGAGRVHGRDFELTDYAIVDVG